MLLLMTHRHRSCAGERSGLDVALQPRERARALVSKLQLHEKIGLLDADVRPTGKVPRLGIPDYQGWNGAHMRTYDISCPQ